MKQQEFTNAPIGVMDSGVGGISVLRELNKRMPCEDYLYFGDSAHAPYGTKTVEEVRELTLSAADFLVQKGAKALVVACNTATSAAIPVLRKKYSKMPVIGIEPALKPAVLAKEHPSVLVMATPMTLEQEKFANLLHSYEEGANITKVPCPGLVELIEDGILSGPILLDYLKERFAPYAKEKADAIVLGCTHYPLIRAVIQNLFPTAQIFDGGPGTARQTKRRLEEAGLLTKSTSPGKTLFFNSKDTAEMIALSERLFALPE